MVRPSRNQRSADSFVRVLFVLWLELADKAVRAPGKSLQDAKMLENSVPTTLPLAGQARCLPYFDS